MYSSCINILLGHTNRLINIRIVRKLLYQSVPEAQQNVDTGGAQFLKIEKSFTVPFTICVLSFGTKRFSSNFKPQPYPKFWPWFGTVPRSAESLTYANIDYFSQNFIIFTYLLLYLKNLFLLIESLWLFWFYCTKTLWLIVNCPSLPVPPYRLESSLFWPQFDLDLISRISYLSLFEGHF